MIVRSREEAGAFQVGDVRLDKKARILVLHKHATRYLGLRGVRCAAVGRSCAGPCSPARDICALPLCAALGPERLPLLPGGQGLYLYVATCSVAWRPIPTTPPAARPRYAADTP